MGVSDRVRTRGLTAVAVAGTAVVAAAVVSMLARGRPLDLYYELFIFHNAPGAVVLLWLSWLVLRRYPRHGAGIVLLAVALASGVHVVVAVLLDARLDAFGMDLATLDPDVELVPAEMPVSAAVLHMLLATVWVPASVPVFTLLVLLFPDGRLPSPRWRWAAVAAVAGMAVVVTGFAIVTWPTVGEAEPSLGGVPIDAVLIAPGGLAIVVAAAASVVALIMRWRRTTAAERAPFRAVAIAVLVLTVVATAAYPWQDVWIPAVLVAFNAVLVTYSLAVGRYRLHDLEPILGRAVVVAILAFVVAAVYVAIVVGIGSLVGRGSDNAVLPLIAVAVVALLVEPARRRARRLVDRLVYRRRATHGEVLSELARSASTDVPERVMDEVATLLVTSTGASRAEVWLDVSPEPSLAAAAGEPAQPEPILRSDVTHRDERLGEVRLYAPTKADLVPDAADIVDDVAHAIGVVMRNARLTAQLRAQLEDLHASRQRLVEVHDDVRRGLERDIHDGAQSRLVALRLRLGLARAYADAGDPVALAEQLDTIGAEADAAVRLLRELARGLHPPLLEQSGIAAALESHARTLPIRVTVDAHEVGRYPRAVEGAVYFCCLEAIQNALAHGGAGRVDVGLAADADALRFTVRDDGVGFDVDECTRGRGLTNMHDRVAALGGQLRVDARSGRGACVTGTIPVQELVSDK